jgi:transposase
VFPERRTQIKPAQTEVCATGPRWAYALSARKGTGQWPQLNSCEKFALVWRQKPEQQQWLEAREGAYLLRTNLTANGAADLWKKYMQLTEVEAAFRTLKSEWAIRPLFHQLEKRVKAHVLVAFLGYALLVTLEHFHKSCSVFSAKKETLAVDDSNGLEGRFGSQE